jgi:hypothetical protein
MVPQAFVLSITGKVGSLDTFALAILPPGSDPSSTVIFPFCEPETVPCTDTGLLQGTHRLRQSPPGWLVLERSADVTSTFHFQVLRVPGSGRPETVVDRMATASPIAIRVTYTIQ